MKILVVSSDFPSHDNPHRYYFMLKFVNGLLENKQNVQVVCPYLFSFKSKPKQEFINCIERPIFFSFLKAYSFLPKKFAHIRTLLKTFSFEWAVKRSIKKVGFKPDVIYCHFIESAIPLVDLAQIFNIPLVVGVGESSFDKYDKNYLNEYFIKKLNKIDLFISLSDKNKEILMQKYVVDEKKITVIPNGVEEKFFVKFDKQKVREELGFPEGSFITGFTGGFIERKGPLRVLSAITRLDNVKGVFIGKGEQVPEGGAVIFANKLNNDDIPKYLSACDVFVLPTLNEGSCNAIIEAMACGLPIVSSTIDSIKEQVPADCGLLVDPLNIDELEKALLRLKSDKELLSFLSGNSLNYALNFSNSKRVARIIELFKSLIEVNRK